MVRTSGSPIVTPIGEVPDLTEDSKAIAAEERRMKKLKRIFMGLAFVQVVTNFDGGAVPASLLQIQSTFGLSQVQTGLIGSLVYEGIALGSLCVGPLLQHVSPLRCTQITLILNTSATLFFGLAASTPMLLCFRFLIGFLQAVPAVYFPVWVDEFAPTESATVWMAAIQGTAPFGILIGYVVAGAVTASQGAGTACEMDWFNGYTTFAPPSNATNSSSDLAGSGSTGASNPFDCGWRVPFLLQSSLLIVISIIFLFIPRSLYDLQVEDDESVAVESTANRNTARTPKSRSSVATFGAISRQAIAERHAQASMAEGGEAQPGASAAPSSRRDVSRRTTFSQAGFDGFQPLAARSAFMTALQATEEDLAAVEESIKLRPSQRNSISGRDSRRSSAASHAGMRVGAITPVTPDTAGSGKDGRDRQGSRMLTPLDMLRTTPSPDASAPVAAPADGASSTSIWQSPICRILTSPVYVFTVAALSALFFVVTGIQFWITIFFLQVMNANPGTVIAVFGVTSITAPTIGVIVGGMVTDSIGGYKGASGIRTTLTLCCVACGVAGTASVLCAFVPRAVAGEGTTFYEQPGNPVGVTITVAFIAVILFFGGMVIPAANGVIVTSVPPELRQLASAGSIFFFQQFGYFLAPILSGSVSAAWQPDIDAALDRLPAERRAYISGNATELADFTAKTTTVEQADVAFKTVLCWASLGVVCMLIARHFAAREASKEMGKLLAHSQGHGGGQRASQLVNNNL